METRANAYRSNYPEVTWKQEQMLTDRGLLGIFFLVGPIELSEVPGSDIQIVLALTRCASFTEERRWHLGSSSRVGRDRNGVKVKQGYCNMDQEGACASEASGNLLK